MVLFSFGLPGQFADWCDAITARITEVALGSITVMSAETPEDLAVALLKAEGGGLFVSGRQPGAWLGRVLATTEKPFIVSLGDPRSMVWELVSRRGLNLADATRQVGASCAAIMRYIDWPRALILNASQDWQQPAATTEAIARHFGLALNPVDIAKIVDDLMSTSHGPDGQSPDAASSPDRLTERNRAVVDGAVAPYLEHFLGDPLGRITWVRELFLADGHRPAVRPVDVTGRVRALIYGPYIRLPLGTWMAEVVLGFSEEATHVTFVVDVLSAGSQLCVTSLRPPHQGVYSVNLSFVINEQTDHPVEFRVVNERAAFDGKVALSHVLLSRQQKQSDPTIDIVKTELGLTA
jgi:hypothetical protein